MLSFLKNFFIVFFLVIFYNSQVQAGHKNYKLRTVEKVLSNLYRAASIPQIHKPKIALVKGSSIGAVYVPGQNLIRIEEKLYDICIEFNKDSLNALAFVISHELSHAIQKHVKFSNDASNFLMTNNMGKSKFHEEKEADLQGHLFVIWQAIILQKF
ncbi:MAG: M48 family metalloprotease [Saprospiraceae bacterium]|nr:M48 family metalloprotease [Candidatus Vicinibacter affinis]